MRTGARERAQMVQSLLICVVQCTSAFDGTSALREKWGEAPEGGEICSDSMKVMLVSRSGVELLLVNRGGREPDRISKIDTVC